MYKVYLKTDLTNNLVTFNNLVEARNWFRENKSTTFSPINYVMIDNNNHWYDCDLHESWV